jgi:sacsin
MLQTIVLHYLRSGTPTPESRQSLKLFPVFPRLAPTKNGGVTEFMSLSGGIICADEAMLHPWTTNRENWIDPAFYSRNTDIFAKLEVVPQSMEDIWKRTSSLFPPAGTVVPEDQRAKYLRFIQQLPKLKYPLSAPPLAVNPEYELCQPNSLYDHTNDLFLAAFRLEKRKFLHSDVRQMDHWKRFGLRASDGGYRLPAEYYLDCIRAMSARYDGYVKQSDINFLADCERVANLVCGYISVSIDGIHTVWRAVLKAPIFQVRRDVAGESWYRKARMRSLASQRCTTSPENAGRIKDINISWSQVVFLKPEPVVEVYSVHPSKGSPSVRTVVAHLQYLIDIRTTVSQEEVGLYLKDVQDTYAFLQTHVSEAQSVPSLRSGRVWLNLETTDVDRIKKEDLGGALTSADRLCFRCPVDPGKLKFVRSFLTPFEKLLTALGCQSVKQPPLRARRESLDDTAQPMARVMDSICQLRKKGELFDITLSAMDKGAPCCPCSELGLLLEERPVARWKRRQRHPPRGHVVRDTVGGPGLYVSGRDGSTSGDRIRRQRHHRG